MPQDTSPFDYEAALAACAAGDRQAFELLYQQEGARMLGVALRIVRQRALAEDIVHDACIAIWTRAKTYNRTRGSARGWIYTVVRNLALNAVRSDSRYVEADEATTSVADVAAAVAVWQEQLHTLNQQSQLGRLHECLQGLEPERRHCMLHAYVDGCTHAEIAKRMGAPLGTVKAWIRRSLGSLRECLA